MVKFYLLFLFVLCISLQVDSQNYTWAQRLGNTKSDKVTCIKTDGFGNVYIAGYFGNTITLGTNNLVLNYVANTNSKEAYIAKLDSTGFCLWAKAGGNYFDDRVLGMDVDSLGYATITGTFWESGSGIDWGTVSVTGSAYGHHDQCFIVRFDPSGNVVWGNFVCGDNTTPSGGNYRDDQGLDVAMDKYGNAYVVGFMTTVTLYCGGNVVTATNPNTTQHKHCYWLAKINSAGVFQWARTFGNLPWDGSYKYIERDIAVCVDNTNGVYVTGGFDSTRHFGPLNFTSYGGHDIFAMKYDNNGNFVWATHGGSDKDDWSNGICSDKNGFIYITGEHRDSLIIDTVIVKNYDKRDVFVAKLDANTGKPIWGKRAGSPYGGERGNDIWADFTCNVYVAGDINEGAKFGDEITTPFGNMEQSFVAKMAPDGKWLWVTTGGCPDSNDRGNAIAKGKGSQIYTAGYFRNNATYGATNLNSAGSSDGFFARLHDSIYNKGRGFDFPSPGDTVLCKGQMDSIAIDDHVYFEYNPKVGCGVNADESMFYYYPSSTTTYTLTGIGKTSCPEYDTLVFTVIIAPDPVASFVSDPEMATTLDPNFTFTNTSTGAINYEWYYDNNLLSTSQDLTKNFDSVGEYCITLVAESNEGCLDTTINCVKVVKQTRLFFPNAFTPNGDQRNDEYHPVIINIDYAEIRRYKLTIVNRFGEIVFESSDPSKGWDGTKRGDQKPCDVGVYYYMCTIQLPFSEYQEFKGDITLMR